MPFRFKLTIMKILHEPDGRTVPDFNIGKPTDIFCQHFISLVTLRSESNPFIVDRSQPVIQIGQSFLFDLRRYSVICFGNRTGDRSDGIAVSAERNSRPNRILKGSGFKKTFNRLRYGLLASLVKTICRPNIVYFKIERIIIANDALANLRFSRAFPCQINSHSG